MIPFNLTNTPAGFKQLKHEASTPEYPRYSETAAVLVDALDRYQQRYEAFVDDVDTAMAAMGSVVAELNDLCDVHDMPPALQQALRDLADRLEDCLVEPPGDPV